MDPTWQAGAAGAEASDAHHRDIKLDNTLLSAPSPAGTVKLTDFQFSKHWGPTPATLARMHTHLGWQRVGGGG